MSSDCEMSGEITIANTGTITRSLPELDAVIDGLNDLANSREPRSHYGDALTDQIIKLASVVRLYFEHSK